LQVETRPRRAEAEFVVNLVVVDTHDPGLERLERTAATVLAVSSGAATAEDLARVAVAADESGRSIDGLVVVNPDPGDRTTGRMRPRERSRREVPPSRLTSVSSAQGRGRSATKDAP
jgi:hypothetical protein